MPIQNFKPNTKLFEMSINSTISLREGDKTQLALEKGQQTAVTAAVVIDHLFAGVHLKKQI